MSLGGGVLCGPMRVILKTSTRTRYPYADCQLLAWKAYPGTHQHEVRAAWPKFFQRGLTLLACLDQKLRISLPQDAVMTSPSMLPLTLACQRQVPAVR